MPNSTLETELVKLEDVCHLITDGKHGDCAPDENSGYYFLSAKDVREGKLVYENSRQITKEDFLQTHRRTQLEPLDVLIVSTGATIGRMAMASDSEFTARTTFQKSVAIIKPNKEFVSPHWLYYKLNQIKDILINMSGGTAQGNLLLRDLRALQIEVPPLPTQRRIAEILSAYDDLIENNIRRIRILEGMAQSVYREWFGQANAESLPDGWEVTTLGQVCNIVMGQSPASNFYNEEAKGLPFHQGVTNFGDRFPTDKVFCTVENRIAEKGDILFSVRAPVGRLNISTKKIVIGRGLCAIRSKTGNQAFVFQQMKEQFQEDDMIGGGTIFKSVTKDDVYGIKFLLPPKEIIEKFETFASPISRELEILTEKNANLRRTRDMLLPRLVGGEVAV